MELGNADFGLGIFTISVIPSPIRKKTAFVKNPAQLHLASFNPLIYRGDNEIPNSSPMLT